MAATDQPLPRCCTPLRDIAGVISVSGLAIQAHNAVQTVTKKAVTKKGAGR